MITENEVLTATDKEVIKYADLILKFFKNNYPDDNAMPAGALKIKEQVSDSKYKITHRANVRRTEQLQLQDNSITGEKRKQLLLKIDAGKKLDEATVQYAEALQFMYLSFLNKNNAAQA